VSAVVNALYDAAVALVQAHHPALADPVLADPVLADPVLADPVLADPVLADPVLADGLPLAHGGDEGPFTPAVVLVRAEPFSVISLALLAAAALYLWGVARLHRRGDRWPAGRSLVFLGGLVAVASVTVSGIAAFDTILLSVHMVQHMVLSMIAPILLALGAPVTLALRTLPPSPRRILLAVLHSSFARLITFPIVTFGLFVATPFVLYFSGLYRASLADEWVHGAVHLHFLAVGCLFFWPLIGLDPLPGRMPYPLRALLMVLSVPFHTVLGLTVMQSAGLLGGDWYPSLHLDWADPYADQRVAGGILWAGGEFVAVGMLGALVFQWMRDSEREARRVDRALDRAEAEQAAAERAAAEQGAAEQGAAERAAPEQTAADRAPVQAAAERATAERAEVAEQVTQEHSDAAHRGHA
jgi:cytochrome c oxidase assembly factor CtaG